MHNDYIYLSHFISVETPIYGGTPRIEIVRDKQIQQGDSCNTAHLRIPNHCSTHIDFPRHFSDSGKTLTEYKPEFWFFQNVYLLDVKAEMNTMIDLRSYLNGIPEPTDLLLVRTGFQKYRTKEIYWSSNPGLLPEGAPALKKSCPRIKAVGIDCISVSGFNNRELGRRAHRSFLIEQDILLIEDMNLEHVTKPLSRVFAFPFLLQDADGCPVTVVGEQTTDE